jgi:hypothetical protein
MRFCSDFDVGSLCSVGIATPREITSESKVHFFDAQKHRLALGQSYYYMKRLEGKILSTMFLHLINLHSFPSSAISSHLICHLSSHIILSLFRHLPSPSSISFPSSYHLIVNQGKWGCGEVIALATFILDTIVSLYLGNKCEGSSSDS